MVIAEGDQHCEARDAANDPNVFAAYLWYDGYVALPSPTVFVPISSPIYTQGRPEREAVPNGTSYCIPACGIPMLSDRLYRVLVTLGAEGVVGDIIYRGFSKKAYNTVQEGFHRFLPSPMFDATEDEKLIVALPDEPPSVFAIRATVSVKYPKRGTRIECHIGLAPQSLGKLATSLPGVLVAPLRRQG